MTRLLKTLKKNTLASAGVRRSLQLGFGFVLLCLIGITGLAQWTLEHSSSRVQEVALSQTAAAELTREMSDAIGRAYQSLLSTVLLDAPEDLAFQKERLLEALTRYDKSDQALSLALRGSDRAVQERHKTLRQLADEVRRSLEPMQDRLTDPSERELMAGFVANTMQPNFETWQQALQQLDQARKETALSSTADVRQDVRTARFSLLAAAIFAFVVGCAATVLISRAILRPLGRAVMLAEAVAQGDLTVTIDQQAPGELGALTQALGDMQQNLRDLVSQVQQSSEGVMIAANEIAQGHEDLSNRTEHTAASLQQAASAVSELSKNTRTTSSAARRAHELSQASETATRQGDAIAREVAQSMESIELTGKQMTEIVQTIEGIAFRTNILALNASVEAARAGEYGRSFAVVAEEVRNLAQRCATASQDIRTLINSNIGMVSAGQQHVNKIVQAMGDIHAAVHQVGNLISDISGSAQLQDNDALNLTTTVESIDAMTQKNAALVEETTAATFSLRDEMAGLSQLVNRFKIRQT
ncbi:MAG TPA: methyl-accepting chemotaxis protein [Macromonas sp.]|nr:methyl-accepting chemotaxis protein [Macromonas sp.]